LSPPFAQTVVLAALLAIVTTTGALLARAAGLRRWSRRTPDTIAVCGGLGAMAWIIGFSVLSGPGRLPAKKALAVLVVAIVALAGAVTWKREQRQAPLYRREPRAAFTLAGAGALAAVLSLLPVWTSQGFQAGNDTYTYCALAEWLQYHGFGEAASHAPDRPVDSIAALQQDRGFPLGGSYPLALARAAGLGSTALGLYPAVSALGLVLTVGALWAATRQVLRTPPSVTAAAVFFFAAAPHAGYWAHHNGFLSQTYATPGLLLGLTALSAGRGLRDRSGLVLWAVAFAFLCFVYVPFLPLLAMATLAHAATGVTAGHGWRRVSTRLGLATLLALVLICFDVVSPVRGLLVLSGVPAGAHVSLTPSAMAAMALGTGPGAADGVPRRLDATAGWLTGPAAVLVALGCAARTRDPRFRGVLAALSVLGALALWNSLVARDPWTDALGHTWNLFKIAQWAFPLLLLAEAGGLAWAAQRAPRVELVFLAGGLALAPAHLPWAADLGRGLAGLIDVEHPLGALDKIVRRFETLPPGRVLLLGQPEAASPFRGAYASLLAWPRRVVGDWGHSASVPLDPSRALWQQLLAHIDAPGVVPLLVDAPPFDRTDREELGGGFARLTSVRRPRLLQIVAPRSRFFRVGPPGPVVAPAGQRTKLLVLTPPGEPADVVIRVERRSGVGSVPILCQVVPDVPGRATYRQVRRATAPKALDVGPSGCVVVPVPSLRRLTTIVLEPEAAPVRLVSVSVISSGTGTPLPCPRASLPQ
jgi:hypothetical protein